MRMYVRTHITPFGRIRTRRMYVIRLRLGCHRSRPRTASRLLPCCVVAIDPRTRSCCDRPRLAHHSRTIHRSPLCIEQRYLVPTTVIMQFDLNSAKRERMQSRMRPIRVDFHYRSIVMREDVFLFSVFGHITLPFLRACPRILASFHPRSPQTMGLPAHTVEPHVRP